MAKMNEARVKHKMYKRVKNAGRHGVYFCYRDEQQKERKLKGVTKLFERVFGSVSGSTTSTTASKHARGHHSALKRGVRIHLQLEALASQVVVGGSAAPELKNVDLLTRRIWSYIVDQLQWQPVDAEVIVRKGCIGTAVDLVCVCRRTGRPKLVEVKTGYEGSGYMTANGCFRGTTIHRNFFNAHSMQLTETAHLFTKTFGIPLERDDVAIVRADACQVERFLVNPDVWKKAASLHNKAATFLRERRRIRRTTAAARRS